MSDGAIMTMIDMGYGTAFDAFEFLKENYSEVVEMTSLKVKYRNGDEYITDGKSVKKLSAEGTIIFDEDGGTLGEMIDGVQVINTVKLISAAIPGYWDNGNYCNYDYNTSWDKMTEFVKKYVDEKDIYYYSEEKQVFLIESS